MQWGRGCIFPCSRAHVSLLNLVSFICLLASLARKEKQVHMLLTTLMFSIPLDFLYWSVVLGLNIMETASNKSRQLLHHLDFQFSVFRCYRNALGSLSKKDSFRIEVRKPHLVRCSKNNTNSLLGDQLQYKNIIKCND